MRIHQTKGIILWRVAQGAPVAQEDNPAGFDVFHAVLGQPSFDLIPSCVFGDIDVHVARHGLDIAVVGVFLRHPQARHVAEDDVGACPLLDVRFQIGEVVAFNGCHISGIFALKIAQPFKLAILAMGGYSRV